MLRVRNTRLGGCLRYLCTPQALLEQTPQARDLDPNRPRHGQLPPRTWKPHFSLSFPPSIRSFLASTCLFLNDPSVLMSERPSRPSSPYLEPPRKSVELEDSGAQDSGRDSINLLETPFGVEDGLTPV